VSVYGRYVCHVYAQVCAGNKHHAIWWILRNLYFKNSSKKTDSVLSALPSIKKQCAIFGQAENSLHRRCLSLQGSDFDLEMEFMSNVDLDLAQSEGRNQVRYRQIKWLHLLHWQALWLLVNGLRYGTHFRHFQVATYNKFERQARLGDFLTVIILSTLDVRLFL